MGWAEVFLIIFLAVLVVGCFRSVHVGDGYVACLERFGHFVRVLEPGTHVIFAPFYRMRFAQFVTYTEAAAAMSDTGPHRHVISRSMIPTIEQMYDPPDWSMMTRDGMPVTVKVVIFYRIVDARRVAYESVNHVDRMRESVRASLKEFVASFDVFDVHARIDASQKSLVDLVDAEHLADIGLVVNRVRLQNFALPEEINTVAMASVGALRDVQTQRLCNDARHANELRALEQSHLLERKRSAHQGAMLQARTLAETQAIKNYGIDATTLTDIAAWRASATATHWSTTALVRQ